ncbi:hypothetical protein A3A93_01855 [Candidatus Roizmanbacteria bacterium RIFCSPLOWO2_01_FULL_38_12]|uniref:tRNA/rRNA methyltransferase SpoU type domain-containing protein n=1 Tax=Candidatus Roizmanbacteria bacterium RIFCSPLOWO2_01_FULL_38_12 TaxID=1802061 RepID=A0A1F7IXT9_9BACT|nr:MAG: hypothetical protein A2861_01375 [Candidatus Roizmanbacteria bacterium RIFCSPHIGHO2_01_FULL_38_15]OGK36022.1 MAG: hypothetical protein A3F59_01200 [Candidatus Roizmanbacteria bacterium RIFCSPHIGHO2_12_FULL_38_13]OGK48198.1 MAG: hypothetical protein A3A93_01855 [Candidatus Roizmanbacteria bacterium RIFCSPLOWO2_01_FULL_38_12]
MNFSSKKYKKSFDYSYSIGVYSTLELLTYKLSQTVKVFLHSKSGKNKGAQKILSICKASHIETEIADGLLTKLSNSENCYAIGFFRKFGSNVSPKKDHIVLDSPSDMGNVGTIMRTMLGFGINDLAIMRPALDIFDPRVIRASQGAVFQINYRYFNTFKEYQTQFPRNFYPFMLEGINIDEVVFEKAFSLIFGNEGSGLNRDFLKIGKPVKIPQTTKIDSLNLSVAVGIALYESYNQNRKS